MDALLKAAPHPQAALLMVIQWRAGLRMSEALNIEERDLSLDVPRPTLRVLPHDHMAGAPALQHVR